MVEYKRVTGKSFRFMTANVAKENVKRTNVYACFKRIMESSDIAVLQEVENPILRALILVQARRYGFTVWFPGNHAPSSSNLKGRKLGSAANAVCIIWRTKRFKSTSKWATYALRKGQAGDFPSKFAPFIELLDLNLPHKGVDRQHRLVEVFAYHNVPGVFSGRIPKNRDDWYAIQGGVERQTGVRDDPNDPPLIGGADTNNPHTNMKGLAEHTPAHGTHHGEHIDVVFSSNCTVSGSTAVWLAGSDHYGNLVHVTPLYRKRVA